MRRQAGEALEKPDTAWGGKGRTVGGHGEGWVSREMEIRVDAWSAEPENSGSTASKPGRPKLEQLQRRVWLARVGLHYCQLVAEQGSKSGDAAGTGWGERWRWLGCGTVVVMAYVWLVAQVTSQESNWNKAIDICSLIIFKSSNAVKW